MWIKRKGRRTTSTRGVMERLHIFIWFLKPCLKMYKFKTYFHHKLRLTVSNPCRSDSWVVKMILIYGRLLQISSALFRMWFSILVCCDINRQDIPGLHSHYLEVNAWFTGRVGGQTHRQTDKSTLRWACAVLYLPPPLLHLPPPLPLSTCALLTFLTTKNAFIFCAGPAKSSILLLFPTLLESIRYLGRGFNLSAIDVDYNAIQC